MALREVQYPAPSDPAGRSDSLLSLSGVSLRYPGATQASLTEVDLELRAGETLGLLGLNGAGKSSLLKIMARIIEPDEGRVRLRARRVCLLSLEVGFLPHLSGRDNAILSGMFLGLRRRAIEARLPEIRAFANLGDHFEAPVGTYSVGMRSRLGMGVALQVDCDVLLVDEALAVGDVEFRDKSARALRHKLRDAGAAVVASHDLEQVRLLADRAVWLDQGRLVMSGPPDAVIENYLTRATGPSAAKGMSNMGADLS